MAHFLSPCSWLGPKSFPALLMLQTPEDLAQHALERRRLAHLRWKHEERVSLYNTAWGSHRASESNPCETSLFTACLYCKLSLLLASGLTHSPSCLEPQQSGALQLGFASGRKGYFFLLRFVSVTLVGFASVGLRPSACESRRVSLINLCGMGAVPQTF